MICITSSSVGELDSGPETTGGRIRHRLSTRGLLVAVHEIETAGLPILERDSLITTADYIAIPRFGLSVILSILERDSLTTTQKRTGSTRYMECALLPLLLSRLARFLGFLVVGKHR